MGRLAWSQLRFRPARALALLMGLLVAAAAFTVLTAASRTAQLRTIGQVTANFRPAYDILVRPKGSRTAVETTTGTVQPDFLSGIYGGITTSQWRQLQEDPRRPDRCPDRDGRLRAARWGHLLAGTRGRPQRDGPPAVPLLHHLCQ